jgi:hypothetical protein
MRLVRDGKISEERGEAIAYLAEVFTSTFTRMDESTWPDLLKSILTDAEKPQA